MRLPRELRDIIWEMVVPEGDFHVVDIWGRISPITCLSERVSMNGRALVRACSCYLYYEPINKFLVALPFTCRQIYLETLDLVYTRRILIFDALGSFLDLHSSLPIRTRNSISDIAIDVHWRDFVEIQRFVRRIRTLEGLQNLTVNILQHSNRDYNAFKIVHALARIENVKQSFRVWMEYSNYIVVKEKLARSNVGELPFELTRWHRRRGCTIMSGVPRANNGTRNSYPASSVGPDRTPLRRPLRRTHAELPRAPGRKTAAS